jgi:hypothetical protein
VAAGQAPDVIDHQALMTQHEKGEEGEQQKRVKRH